MSTSCPEGVGYQVPERQICIRYDGARHDRKVGGGWEIRSASKVLTNSNNNFLKIILISLENQARPPHGWLHEPTPTTEDE
jgi:hypothetical protein